MSTETLVVIDIPAEASKELAAPSEKASALFLPFREPFANAAALLAEESEAIKDAKTARALRLKLVKARTAITATKDAAKADIKMTAAIIDWYHNRGKNEIAQAEARLDAVEKEEERKEAERKARLRATRLQSLAEVELDGSAYPLADMSEDDFLRLHAMAKAAHVAKIEAARREEEERIAREKAEAEARAKREAEERAERERMAAENARLRAEAEKRESEAKAERERIAKERAEAEAKARAEREAIEAQMKAEREARERAEAEAKRERERIAQIEQQRLAAEAKAKAEAEEARRAAAVAPDKEKLAALGQVILGVQMPTMQTKEGALALATVEKHLRDVVRVINVSVESL